MANVVGRSARVAPDLGAAPGDVSVHLYGKAPRPGRKLGHVIAVGADLDEVGERARRATEAIEGQGVRP